jgi:NADH-quinone oxidoreductase subunit I
LRGADPYETLKMSNFLTEIYAGLKSLFIGMRITLGQFFKPTITVHYPHETLKIPRRFRGHIELVRDPATGKAKCFVCKLCEKACPSDCITVEGIKPEGAKRKTVTNYRLDFTKCSLCGSCVEACRDGAIRFSRDYNLASTSKEEFIMDLFQRLEAERGESSESSSASKGETPAPAPSTANPPNVLTASEQAGVVEPKVVAAEAKVEAP